MGFIKGISVGFVLEGESETHFLEIMMSCLRASSSPIEVCLLWKSLFHDLDWCFLFLLFFTVFVWGWASFYFQMLSLRFLLGWGGLDVLGLCNLTFSHYVFCYVEESISISTQTCLSKNSSQAKIYWCKFSSICVSKTLILSFSSSTISCFGPPTFALDGLNFWVIRLWESEIPQLSFELHE